VDAGFRLMTEHDRNWHWKVDDEKLDIQSGKHCAAAQFAAIHGSEKEYPYSDGIEMLGVKAGQAQRYGFKSWMAFGIVTPRLNAEWKRRIHEADMEEAAARRMDELQF
jgi:hypothetical protein